MPADTMASTPSAAVRRAPNSSGRNLFDSASTHFKNAPKFPRASIRFASCPASSFCASKGIAPYSKPSRSTNPRMLSGAHSRTSCPRFRSSQPRHAYGCTSPRDPYPTSVIFTAGRPFSRNARPSARLLLGPYNRTPRSELAGQRGRRPVDVVEGIGRVREVGGHRSSACSVVAFQELVDHGSARSDIRRAPLGAVATGGARVSQVVADAERFEGHFSYVRRDPSRVAVEAVVRGAWVIHDEEAAWG